MTFLLFGVVLLGSIEDYIMSENILDRHSDLVLSASIIYTAKEISALGYKIVQSSDFSRFKQICQMRDDRMLTEQCDEVNFDFTSGNSFSLVLYDEQDKLVATIAARKDCLGRTSLAQLLSKQYPRILGGEAGAEHAPRAHEITGDVVYQGDFWIAKKHKVRGLGHLLPRLSLLISLSRFKPDFCYAVVAPRMAEAWLPIKSGYACCQTQLIDWSVVPEGTNENFALVYSNLSDLQHLAYGVYARSELALAA